MNDTIVSFIRTYVPVVVGTILAFLANRGFDIEINQNAVVVAVIAIYYAIARALEKRWPFFGVLLGVPKEPAYEGTPGPPSVNR
jgi:uncharacterized membrane protein (DUF441 family)